jgi:hypothetical protein
MLLRSFLRCIGEALRDIGIVAYLDHYWPEKFSSTAGYSRVSIDNSELQLPTAFRLGQYATANLVWYPVKNVMMGGESNGPTVATSPTVSEQAITGCSSPSSTASARRLLEAKDLI